MEFWLLALISSLGVTLLGWVVGSRIERSHYRSIQERETVLAPIPTLNTRVIPTPDSVQRAELVTGSVTLSVDRFKQFLGGLRQIFGGEIQSYSSVLDRARREAILRMKESAPGADLFANLRLETSTVSLADNDKEGTVDIIAYATAVWYR